MILLTGATGTVGRAVLRRLIDAGSEPVRCLVRDPRRLGPDRVRVQLTLGDLADPGAFRQALRGVQTVVHLGASIRDQPSGSLEALNGLATVRLVRAAERAGASRFLFFSALGASAQSDARFMRSKAKAAGAVAASALQSTVFAPSIVYTPGDPWLSLLERLALLPALPVSGDGRAVYQPIWAEDVADCVVAALDRPGSDGHREFDLAGPQSLSYDDIVRAALLPLGRSRPLVHVPLPVVKAVLNGGERVLGPAAPATWEEAKLMEESMTTSRGTADAEALGVNPLRMSAVLGSA
ncbi:MAG TPA: NAD(P)H-binding protein [Thermoleophilaceae bacterium]|nr:NAD(P)H-binding protein [Thermoleophilaceae bacterium]